MNAMVRILLGHLGSLQFQGVSGMMKRALVWSPHCMQWADPASETQ